MSSEEEKLTTSRLSGFHAVGAALRHDPQRLLKLWVDQQRRDARMRELLATAAAAGVVVIETNRAELDKLSKTRHQGVVADYHDEHSRYRERDLGDLLDAATPGPPLLLVLDGVQDPHNLGACLRTAAAAGVTAVIVPEHKAVGLTPTVRKVASGGAEAVPLITASNLARTLRQLKDRGLWLIGTADDATQSLYQTDLSGPCVILLGGEEQGLRTLTRRHCDAVVALPMAPSAGAVTSLNVSVAAGIALYEAVRQRGA